MYVYGKNVANEILKNRKKIKKAFLYKDFSDNKIIESLKCQNVSTKFLSKLELDKMVDGNHQGIIIEIEDYQYSDIEELLVKEDPLLVILDHLEDPHNFGAIIRTCEAAGVDGIIIPKNRSVDVNSTVMRTSVGALDNVKVAQVTNLKNTINYLKNKGFWIVGTDMDGTNYQKIDYKGKIAIVTGSEGFGMSRIVKEACDFIATIPMKGSINSLNASVATALVVYEAVNQRANEL
ncbi:MAG: 23S rRNA (guanosine(2251)-2'-O)-methyltransferase RlmB [Firmicutes bacterium]|nr:23S rRNA (guanosine(2251)-2'-O)-methyltransferase RlmB [Bacillota bacterium]